MTRDYTLFDPDSGASRGHYPIQPQALAPGAAYWAQARVAPGGEGTGLVLYPGGSVDRAFALGLDTATGPPAFSPDGRLLAWPNRDGTVSVCDLAALGERLRAISLGW